MNKTDKSPHVSNSSWEEVDNTQENIVCVDKDYAEK